MNYTIESPVARYEAAIKLFKDGQNLAEVAEALGVSKVTSGRYLRTARNERRVTEEEALRLVNSVGGKPRVDLSKSWLMATDKLAGRARALERMTRDRRYRPRMESLIRTHADLRAAYETLGQILEDFEKYEARLNARLDNATRGEN